jgi:hypothetical protein
MNAQKQWGMSQSKHDSRVRGKTTLFFLLFTDYSTQHSDTKCLGVFPHKPTKHSPVVTESDHTG